MPDNTNKRAREGSSSSKKSDDGHSEITLKSIMQKLECIQESLDSNFAAAMCDINSVRADINARLSILKDTTDDLKTSLDAAWVEIEVLKQQDEQNKLQLADFVKENEQLRAELSSTKARVIKLDNYSRRENIRLLNVPENQDENCKQILRGVMAVVKGGCEGASKVEFQAVHCIGKQRDDGKPRARLSHDLSTARPEMTFGIEERSLPTLQIIDMSSWYRITLMKPQRSKRNCQMLCETPEG